MSAVVFRSALALFSRFGRARCIGAGFTLVELTAYAAEPAPIAKLIYPATRVEPVTVNGKSVLASVARREKGRRGSCKTASKNAGCM